MFRILTSSILALILVAGFSPTQAQQDEDRSYILSTATTGGTYYPVGVAIATLTKIRLEPSTGVSLSAISSAGSSENVRLLRDGEVQFAILQGLYGAWAWNGEGPLSEVGPQTNLRAITMLWPNVEHFTVRSEFATTGTIADMEGLRGSRFSIGARNSGTEGSGRHILGALGYDVDTDFDVVFQGYGPSADSLQNHVIDGMNTPAGVPVSAVTRAFAADGEDLAVLGFTEEEMGRVNAQYDLWTRYLIPAGTYPNQDSEISTIAQPNFLTVRADVDEEAVYLITKTIYENLPFLASIHAATSYMDISRAVAGLPMPLHPGALRYYDEVGLEVPEHLRGAAPVMDTPVE